MWQHGWTDLAAPVTPAPPEDPSRGPRSAERPNVGPFFHAQTTEETTMEQQTRRRARVARLRAAGARLGAVARLAMDRRRARRAAGAHAPTGGAPGGRGPVPRSVVPPVDPRPPLRPAARRVDTASTRGAPDRRPAATGAATGARRPSADPGAAPVPVGAPRGACSPVAARRAAARHPDQLALFPRDDGHQLALLPRPDDTGAAAGPEVWGGRPRLEAIAGGRTDHPTRARPRTAGTTRPTPGFDPRVRACRPLPDQPTRPTSGGPNPPPPAPRQ